MKCEFSCNSIGIFLNNDIWMPFVTYSLILEALTLHFFDSNQQNMHKSDICVSMIIHFPLHVMLQNKQTLKQGKIKDLLEDKCGVLANERLHSISECNPS